MFSRVTAQSVAIETVLVLDQLFDFFIVETLANFLPFAGAPLTSRALAHLRRYLAAHDLPHELIEIGRWHTARCYRRDFGETLFAVCRSGRAVVEVEHYAGRIHRPRVAIENVRCDGD